MATVGQVKAIDGNGNENWLEPSLKTTKSDINLTSTAITTIETRPASPTGPGRWKLVEIVLRVKISLDTGSAIVRVGSSSGGQEIVTDQSVLPVASVGDIIGGFSLSTLGTDMSQATGFEAIYPASQSIYAGVTTTGTPTTGALTAYLLWMALP